MNHKLVTTLLLLIGAWNSVSAESPNFLFLLSDDQHWAGLSCQMHPDLEQSRNELIDTPNLARLASEGMRFSAAYSPASVCSPTRVSLQTGKSPAQMNWTKAAPTMTAADNYPLISPTINKRLSTEETTIGNQLQGVGYRTAHYGKWHLGRVDPTSYGYDDSDGPTGNQTAAPFVEPNPVDIFGMGERAVAFMKKSKEEGKPFFIQMSYHALHYPENATAATVAKYRERGVQNPGSMAIADDMDRGIGELLESLDRLGLSQSTYVIFMADNGGNAGRNIRLLRGGKGGVWEGGIRVPMIVRGPGVAPGSWSHQRVVGYDWYPTFCALAGVETPLPSGIEGGTIMHLLKGLDEPVQRPRQELVFHFPHYQNDAPHTALLLGKYKLFRFYEDDSHQLYDLQQDLGESSNIADANPEIVRAMAERMDRYLADVGATFPTVNSSYDPSKPSSSSSSKKKGGKAKGKGKGKKN
ncbi:MAG: sulfatase-like hydrolase/transferase [Verrucomicrobiota bacterium]